MGTPPWFNTFPLEYVSKFFLSLRVYIFSCLLSFSFAIHSQLHKSKFTERLFFYGAFIPVLLFALLTLCNSSLKVMISLIAWLLPVTGTISYTFFLLNKMYSALIHVISLLIIIVDVTWVIISLKGEQATFMCNDLLFETYRISQREQEVIKLLMDGKTGYYPGGAEAEGLRKDA